jgi:dTDP-glucose 4,6-dehydratase
MLGSAVVRVLGRMAQLVDSGTTTIGVARTVCDNPFSGTRFVAGDTTDPRTYAMLPHADYVLHIAGPTSDYLLRPWETIDVTVNGLRRSLDYARDGVGFVFVSSTRVYGPYCNGVIDEQSQAVVDPMSPLNIYDASKRLAESLVMVEHTQNALRGTVVRLTNVYGPYGSHPSGGFLGGLLRPMRDERRVTLTGHPHTTRNYCFVADAAEGLLLALACGARGGAYLIGSDEHRSNADFVGDVAKLVGPGVEVAVSPSAWEAPQSATRVSIDKARNELGYRPQGTLATCLPFVVDWTLQAMEPAAA